MFKQNSFTGEIKVVYYWKTFITLKGNKKFILLKLWTSFNNVLFKKKTFNHLVQLFNSQKVYTKTFKQIFTELQKKHLLLI